MNSPFIHLVPKGIDENLRFRANLVRECAADAKMRRDLWSMCSRDLLFFVNAFCWTHDPRNEDCPVIPFVTWDYQDGAFAAIEDSIGHNDLLFEKSRDMGASWIILTTFYWRWLFRDHQSFLLVSRNEDYVDKPGNSKALFWKIDFLQEHLPQWMVPRFTRTKLRLSNDVNGSNIDGESTTGDVAKGDRRTALALDEFAAFETTDGYKALASTRDVTPCRIFNFTPQGMGNAAAEMAHKPSMRKVRMHWSVHPHKSVGLYRDAKGKPRSPWYDLQCERAANAAEIAQELDIDYLGSGYQFYEADRINEHKRLYAREPYIVGDVVYDEHSLRVIEFAETGRRLKLWVNLTPERAPPQDRQYVIGCDIATGTGVSNSVLSVGDKITHEIVGKFVDANLRPEYLARYAVALARWFNGAMIIPEANGPGRNFIQAVVDAGYLNLWFREANELALSRSASLVPGWYATKDTKTALHGEYRRALACGDCINRDAESLDECKQMVFTAGSVEHSGASVIDPSGARDNHGDRPTADALCWKGMKDAARILLKEISEHEITGTLGYRRKVRLDQAVAASQW